MEYTKLMNRTHKVKFKEHSKEELEELVSDLETALIDARIEICELCDLYICNPECWLSLERDCSNCIHKKENGCEKWDCEFERK